MCIRDRIRALEKRGVHFEHRSLKNGNWNDLEPLHKKKVKKDDPLEKEISKIVAKKKQKVKPGYKVKRKQEVEKLKRKEMCIRDRFDSIRYEGCVFF